MARDDADATLVDQVPDRGHHPSLEVLRFLANQLGSLAVQPLSHAGVAHGVEGLVRHGVVVHRVIEAVVAVERDPALPREGEALGDALARVVAAAVERADDLLDHDVAVREHPRLGMALLDGREVERPHAVRLLAGVVGRVHLVRARVASPRVAGHVAAVALDENRGTTLRLHALENVDNLLHVSAPCGLVRHAGTSRHLSPNQSKKGYFKPGKPGLK